MRRVFIGFSWALLVAMSVSLLFSLAMAGGLQPAYQGMSERVSPLLGIFMGAYFAARKGSWQTGLGVGLIFVGAWIGFWFYVMGRWNPVAWMEEGLPHLTVAHLFWWGLAVPVGLAGGLLGKLRWQAFLEIMVALAVVLTLVLMRNGPSVDSADNGSVAGYQMEKQGPSADGTTVYLLTFDFSLPNSTTIGVYDCDADDAIPYDDANTSYMGQSLDAVVNKLNFRAQAHHRQVLCAINGGFFGASGASVAHHEEPIVERGKAHYNVDLLRPREQAWFLAIHSAASVASGLPRLALLPSIPWHQLEDYETVLGGVRPLRVEGKTVGLKPGAGATALRCSRTSVGWSADGRQFYVLVVKDPDGEAASQFQRKMQWPQTGGWDVKEVQAFWEQRRVPNAVLLDGGESTQLAFRYLDSDYQYVASGYQYSWTLGYLWQRPLLITPPVLPPREAHRGVLNYLYLEEPARR